MKRSTIRKVEDILRDYPKLDKYIEQRESELRYPMSQTDDNVGGGKSNYPDHDGPLRTLITIDEDRKINALKRQRDVIGDLLDECDKDTKTLIQELYFNRHPQFTIEGLVMNNYVEVSRRTAFKLKKEFINELAKALNLDIYDLD
ncbi:transcriptional regulator [uncultured Secundilactobacillus sp.]|uniref:transcriptional regulator n=1 Tax=uncultured Secundilactobacillus sp. TaxID=2813935 RepID=UPI00258782F3|nr:transcriptional regulator [uncultured Secundilactobacillus sp.]